MKKYIVIVCALTLIATSCSKNPISQSNDQLISEVEQETAIPPDMSQWQTYTNDKLGFKISYPPSYKIQENPKLDAPEYNPNYYKNVVLLLSNQEANEKTYGLIYIRKTRSSLKTEVNNAFSWFLNSMTKTEDYWMFDYFTGSATDSNRVYIKTNTTPRYPGDEGTVTGDVLIADVESSYNGDVIPNTTTPDWIARTMNFTK